MKEGKRHGYGVQTWCDDHQRYEGCYKDDYEHGQGTKKWKNGNEYEGEWKRGFFHGTGKYIYGSGEVEEG